MIFKTNKQILIIVNTFKQGGTFNSALNFSIGYNKLGYQTQIIYFKKNKVRKDLKKLTSRHKINLLNYKKINLIKSPKFIHIIGHDIRASFVKKLKLKFPSAKLFESNIFGKKNSYDHLLDASWQLNHWANASYSLSGGKKNYGILPLPVNTDYLLKFKKKFEKNNVSKKNIILKISQKSEGKWCKDIIKVFKEINSVNQKIELILVTPTKTIVEEVKQLDLNTKKKIKIINRVSNIEKIYKLYFQSKIFLHITQQGETFGYVFFEASIFNCNVLSMETPGADNSQVEILREIFSKKNTFNNIKALTDKTINLLSTNTGNNFLSSKVKKYSIKNVCKHSIGLMINDKKKIIKVKKKTIMELVSNYHNDRKSKYKKFFFKSLVFVFSIYSLFIFRKLKRFKII